MKNFRRYTTGVFLLWTVFVRAQEVVFTQPLSALLYTNPAYSGAFGDYRFGTAVRSQFTGSTNPYNTIYADFDLLVPSIRSGFGIYVLNDRSDSWQLASMGLSYSYAFNISENIIVRPSLQAVYYRQEQNSRSYTFPDGIHGNGASSSITYPLSNEVSQEFDFASGVLISHPLWEAGLAARHIGALGNDSLIAYADRSLTFILHGRGAIPLSGRARLKDPDLSDWNAFEHAKLIPHVLVWYPSKRPIFVAGLQGQMGALYSDLNMKSDFTFDVLCFGLSVGLSSERLKIGYNMDMLLLGSLLRGWDSASHELFIHLGFGKTPEKLMRPRKRWKKKSDCIGCPY